MKFQTLTIENFGSIGEMTLPLEGQGLSLILGRNEDAPRADSNGAGKSLPLDAFTWALWGNTIRGFSTDDVVNNKVGKDCSVKVCFSEGGNDYQVIRYRRNKKDKSHKANDLVLMCGTEEVSGASVSATEAMILEIVGLDFITFCAMMPGAGVNVASMTDSEVKGLLERLLRTEALGKASDAARKRHKAVSDQLMIQTTEARDLDVSISEVQDRLTNLKSKEESHERDSGIVLSSMQGKMEEWELQLQKNRDILAELPEALATREQFIKELEMAFELSQKLANYENSTNSQYRNRTSELETFIAVANSDVDRTHKEFMRINKLGDECPICTQEIGTGHKQSLLSALATQKRSEEDRVNIFRASLKKEQDQWEQDLESVREETAEAEEARIVANSALEVAKAVVEGLENVKRNTDKLEADIQDQKKDIEAYELKENPFTSLVGSEEKILSDKQEAQTKLGEAKVELTKTSEILSFWVDSFSPQGIRSFMLEHVTPLLNQFAKKYADLVTEGEMQITFHTKDTLKSGKSKERFNIQVSQKHGGGSYASSSSGERARANLVIALALGELATLRAEKSIPFRFMDEPFESIDESGVEAIVNLLNQQKDRYNTVFVITHQDHFKQLFPNKLTIVKRGGFSSLEE